MKIQRIEVTEKELEALTYFLWCGLQNGFRDCPQYRKELCSLQEIIAAIESRLDK